MIGNRSQWNFNDKWYANDHADVGTGDSDYTFQGPATVTYQFEKFDALFGYRYLKWHLEDGAPLDKLDLSGVMVGARFLF